MGLIEWLFEWAGAPRSFGLIGMFFEVIGTSA